MENEYYCYGEKLKLIKEVDIEGELFGICDNGDGYFTVHRKSDLKKWEETYQFQEQQKIKDQTEKLKAQQAEIAKKIREKALEGIVFRLKLNSAFSKDNKMNAVGIALANEIEKILEKETITTTP